MRKESLLSLKLSTLLFLFAGTVAAQEDTTVKKSLQNEANAVAEEVKKDAEASATESEEASDTTAPEESAQTAETTAEGEGAAASTEDETSQQKKESPAVKADSAMADKAEDLAAVDQSTKAAKAAGDAVVVGATGEAVIAKIDVRPEDWVHAKSLSVGFSGSYTNNNDLLVGATPGTFLQAGGLISGGWGMLKGGHDIMNDLNWGEGIFYSPALGSLSDGNFQKATDNLALTSTYKYHLENIDWVGPYAKLNLSTQVFNNWYIDGVNANLDFETGDPDTQDVRQLEAQKRETISGMFEPTTLQLDVGAFFQPTQHPPKLNYYFNLGLSERSQFARDGHIVTGVEAGTLTGGQFDGTEGNLVTLSKLYDYNSFGLNGQANFNGQLEDHVLWGLNAGAYYPLAIYGSDDPQAENASGIDVLHMNVTGKISLMVNEFLSVDFVQRFIRDPFVTREWTGDGVSSSFSNDWQIQSAILLSAGFNLL